MASAKKPLIAVDDSIPKIAMPLLTAETLLPVRLMAKSMNIRLVIRKYLPKQGNQGNEKDSIWKN